MNPEREATVPVPAGAEPPVPPPPPPGAGRPSFVAREWFFVLLVGLAAIVLATMILAPAEAPEAEPAMLEDAPDAMEIMARLDERPVLKRLLFSFAGGGLLLFLVGLPLLAWFLWQRAEGVPLMGRRDEPPVGWGLWDVIKSAAIYFLTLALLGSLAQKVLSGQAAADLSLVIVFVSNLLLTMFVITLAMRRGPGWQRALGLALGGFWRRVRDGLVGYVAFFPLLIATALVAVLITQWANLEPEQNPLVPMVLGSDSLWFMLFLIFFGGLAGPITEEIFFRGFFYPALRRRVGRAGAVLINALCFAALHGNLVQLAPLIGLGLILALLRERTGSILASTALHCAHNTLVLLLLLTLKPVLV